MKKMMNNLLRKLITTLRNSQRLALKACETWLPPWFGYPLSQLASPYFRLAALAAKACSMPLQQNLVMYEAYNGRDFAGNPYALFLYLLDNPEYSHLVHVLVAPSVNHPKVKAYRDHPRVSIVRADSVAYVRCAQTCEYFINNASYKPYLVKRQGQVYVYTWHSTLLKKLAFDKGAPWEARNVSRALVAADYFISPNRFTTDILLRGHGVSGFVDGAIAEFGYPRNDLTVNGDQITLKARLGLSPDERLVLFAPTWRGEQFAVDTVRETLAWRDSLQASLPAGFRVLVKFHTMVYRFLDAKTLQKCAPLGMDTNELLAAADVLVTDYSGIFFDFLVTGRPVIFFAPDKESYAQAKNGFYLDLDTLPGPVYQDISEVVQAFGRLDEISHEYAGRYSDFRCLYAGNDDGKASERTVDLVFGGKDDPRVYRRDRERQRVLFYPGPMNPNGVTTSFLALLGSLDYARWDVAVMVPEDQRNRIFQARMDSRAAVFYPGAPDGFTYAEYAAHVRFVQHGALDADRLPVKAYERFMDRMCPGVSFDVVVNFHGYQPGDAARLAFGVRAGRRVIFLHNDLERDRRIKQPQLRSVFSTYKFHDRLFSVSADNLRANLDGMAAYVRTTFGDELEGRMDYVRNLMEPDFIVAKSHEACEAGFPLPESGCCSFMTIGRLSPEKNHERLLRAMRRVLDTGLNARLYLVGDGRQAKPLRKLAASLGLRDTVVFIPFLANPYPLMAACDCFMLSSDIEGQPITVLEALCLGKPVIATDIPGPRDQLKDGYGWLVAPDSNALAEGMIRFMSQGRQMERRSFDAVAYVAEVKQEFRTKVLGETS
ncbi:MAG: glycosyltransferase [Spirochaetota bacterium]